MKTQSKPKTVDEVCGSPPGSFQHFVKKKKAYTEQLENERSERLSKTRSARRELAWAA